MNQQVIKAGSPSTAQRERIKCSRNNVVVQLIAGACGGTAGVFLTCPLDVVQTRLQSSLLKFRSASVSSASMAGFGTSAISVHNRFGLHVFHYLRHVVRTEGVGGLYKGLVPNLVGIAPSRAIYFAMYSKTKEFLNATGMIKHHAAYTHTLSALSASFTTSTFTNPIWFLKTRLQLDLTACGMRKSVSEVIRDVMRQEGIRGFYRGLSASYIGAAETVVFFVLYEQLKSMPVSQKQPGEKLKTGEYSLAAFLAKCAATISVYPHEVVRTRLREDSLKPGSAKAYYGFFQTLAKVFREERWGGLYGGMGAHMMRQVPNTVIMFLTYETIVNVLADD